MRFLAKLGRELRREIATCCLAMCCLKAALPHVLFES
jgi:hypothetical protein